jgi:hypothetical protein
VARHAALVFFLVFLTRLPFLGPGFGSDPDAWRIAGAARDIARTHVYAASRFPGAPVVEIADAGLLRFGPWALPLAGALWGAIACATFYVALCGLCLRGCFWAALALAFTPVFWIHTTDAMDYSWALGFAMVALALAVHGRAGWAGAALGLAIGCRLPTAVLIVPIAFLLERGRTRLSLATIIVAALALAPSFLTYGTRFLSVYEFGRVPWIYVIKGATRDVWGVIGTVAIAVAIVIALFRARAVPRRELWAVASAVALTGTIYLRLPHEGAYLLPAVPFVLLFLTRTLAKPGAVALACVVAISSLWINVVQPDPRHPRRPGIESRGPLPQEIMRRRFQIEHRDDVLRYAKALPPNSIVMVYELLPVIQWASSAPGGPRFVHLLDAESAAEARREKRPIYGTKDALSNEWTVFHVRPEAIDARLLGEDEVR